MNHYCTYFDRGFLVQGVALWRSLARHDPDAALWVLALDDETAEALRSLGDTFLRVVPLADLEAADPALAATRGTRSRTEFLFTLSPCWPRWILATQDYVRRVTYLDADLACFSRPTALFAAMEAAGASVMVTAHRFPSWLKHYERHGKFNVGVLSFARDEAGQRCLDEWRDECLAWCHDRVEGGRYADQGYLDDWPARLGRHLLVLDDPGVNAAPWNWAGCAYRIPASTQAPIEVDGRPLVFFHFARFRPRAGTWLWESGQLDYGIMPRRLRDALYGTYWSMLVAAQAELRSARPSVDFHLPTARRGRSWWRSLPLRLVFGGTWIRLGSHFLNLRGGLGRWSGRALGWLRRVVRGGGDD